jgi:hypothetical protein
MDLIKLLTIVREAERAINIESKVVNSNKFRSSRPSAHPFVIGSVALPFCLTHSFTFSANEVDTRHKKFLLSPLPNLLFKINRN